MESTPPLDKSRLRARLEELGAVSLANTQCWPKDHNHTSKFFTALAWVWMNLFLGPTSLPIKMSKNEHQNSPDPPLLETSRFLTPRLRRGCFPPRGNFIFDIFYTSRFLTDLACVCINLFLGATSVPIKMSKILSASAASLTATCLKTRTAGSMVVSHNC